MKLINIKYENDIKIKMNLKMLNYNNLALDPLPGPHFGDVMARRLDHYYLYQCELYQRSSQRLIAGTKSELVNILLQHNV